MSRNVTSILILLLGLGALSPLALAGDAKVLRHGRRKSFVIVDAGKSQGLAKGDEVCFFSAINAPIVCGKVGKLRKHYSGVWIDEKFMHLVPPGTLARSYKIQRGSDGDEPRPDDEDEAAQLAEEEDDKPSDAPKTEGSSHGSVKIAVGFVAGPRLPFVAARPAYDLDAEIAGSGSLWSTDGDIKQSKIGGRLALSFVLAPDSKLTFGVTHRAVPPDTLDLDFDRLDPQVFLRSQTTASSLGLAFGADIAVVNGESLTLGVGAGLGVERSKVTFKATARDAAGGSSEFAGVESTLLSLGPRASVSLGMMAGPLVFALDTSAFIPMSGTAVQSGLTNERKIGASSAQAAAAENDLVTALGHKPVAGIDVGISLTATF